MRNPQDAEAIADRNAADASCVHALMDRISEARRKQYAAAQVGPPKPLGTVVYPRPYDMGLFVLRNQCYAKLRAKKWGAR